MVGGKRGPENASSSGVGVGFEARIDHGNGLFEDGVGVVRQWDRLEGCDAVHFGTLDRVWSRSFGEFEGARRSG